MTTRHERCDRVDMQGDERCGLPIGHDGPDLFPDHFCRIVADKVHTARASQPAPADLHITYGSVIGADGRAYPTRDGMALGPAGVRDEDATLSDTLSPPEP